MSPPILHPTSFQEASRVLQELGPSARLVAGGTDLFVRQRQGVAAPSHWVHLGRIKGAACQIDRRGATVSVGALVTFQQLVDSRLLRETLPALWQAATVMGSQQIRRRGTLGGNMANASPAGDSLPPLLVANAQVVLATPDGERLIPIAELFRGPGRTRMLHHDVIAGVQYTFTPGHKSVFVRVGSRAHHVITKVSMALSASTVQGRLRHVRVALGAVAPTPIRVPAAESLLEGQVLTQALVTRAGEAAAATASPIDDVRSNRRYRSEMCRELVSMALAELTSSL